MMISMKLSETIIAGRSCYIGKTISEPASAGYQPEFLLVQPVDEHDMAGLEHEIDVIDEKTGAPFAFAAFRVNSWNDDLSPWEAPPAFGDMPFGSGAVDTLAFVEGSLIPAAC